MSTVTWTSFSSGDWTVGANWNTGTMPASGDDVLIDLSDNYTVTLAASVTAHSVAFSATPATLDIQNSGGTDTITTFYNNAGHFDEDTAGTGGSTFDIGGTLTNTGTVSLGNASMTTADRLMAGGLNDTGFLFITGGSSSVAKASMLIGGAAPATLTGTDMLTANAGGAVLSFGSGSVTQIGDNVNAPGVFSLDGAGAIAEIGTTGGTSAFADLALIADNGTLELSDGAIVATSTSLTVDGSGEG